MMLSSCFNYAAITVLYCIIMDLESVNKHLENYKLIPKLGT